MNRFDLVVFDLDGTLVDSLQDLAASVNFTLMHYAYGVKSKEICSADVIIHDPRELKNMITIT